MHLQSVTRALETHGTSAWDGLVAVTDYHWDGRLETKRFTLQGISSAWASSAASPALVVNLLTWPPERPTMLVRYRPGLHRARQAGLWVLNVWGTDWRQAAHEGAAVPVTRVAATIARAATALGMTAPVLMASEPAHCRLFGDGPWRLRVWYCTDDYAADDEVRRASIQASMEWALPRADLVAAVSRPLLDAVAPGSPRALLLPNGVDVDGLRALGTSVRTVRGWPAPPAPRVVYLGHVDGRVDWAAMLPCVRNLSAVSFLFVGEPARHDAAVRAALRELEAQPNAWLLGERERPDVAWILARGDLGVIPYAMTPFNRACSPLKALEYAAFGLPVVTTPLPALLDYAGTLAVADPPDMCAAIARELARREERRPELERLARQNDWSARLRTLLACLEQVAADLPRVRLDGTR